MIDENYSSFTKTGPNEGIYQPDQPENHRKERKEGKGERAREKKRTSNSFSSYSVDVRDIFFLSKQTLNLDSCSSAKTTSNPQKSVNCKQNLYINQGKQLIQTLLVCNWRHKLSPTLSPYIKLEGPQMHVVCYPYSSRVTTTMVNGAPLPQN